MNTKTAFLKPEQVDRHWWIVDAKGEVLGRLATKIARILMGKHRASYTPNQDCGDFVVVINAEQVKVTGAKSRNKEYDWYTYHPGGRKVVTYDVMIKKHPTRPIELAVRRMMPKSPLGRHMFSKMKVYAGSDHPHQAQMPQPLKLSTATKK
jgi:large subunit ribosomal protein L13